MQGSWQSFLSVDGINTILSGRGFVPLSRLNYCLSLINFNFFIMCMAYSRSAFYFTFFDYVKLYFGLQFFNYVLSFFASVMVEVPFSNLYNLVSNRGNICNQINVINVMIIRVNYIIYSR